MSELLARKKELEARVVELEKKLHHAREDLAAVDSVIRGRLIEVQGQTRMKLQSKRTRAILEREERRSKYSLSDAPACDFERHFTSTIGADLTVMSLAFRSCGGGGEVLKQIVNVWNNDPAFQYSKRRKFSIAFAMEQGQLLVNMGLCTMAAFGEVFGGHLDLRSKSLAEMRQLAKSIKVPLSVAPVRGSSQGCAWKKKGIEDLRAECRPLMAMSAKNYLIWKEYQWHRSSVHREVKYGRFFYEMTLIQRIPGRDVASEDILNQSMREFAPLDATSVVRVLGMELLPDDHPARYRPSLMRVLVSRLDEYLAQNANAGETQIDGRTVEEKLAAVDARGLRSWVECQRSEALMVRSGW